ncbi:TonB-dependent receptor [Chelatococcus reniformis]|uniref:TonB-dependent receptor n=1 Tax=Chelatococcus reniformis TaxID=1494448 RepID=A0A916UTP9_9HYPH|nr:TonB-dependent receptor [Chelatococcus reniformis]
MERFTTFSVAAALLSGTSLTCAQARQTDPGSGVVELPTISVQAGSPAEELVRPDIEKLKLANDTGSLVGLTPFETPASVDIVTQPEMQQRGLRTLKEVFNAVPGLMAGNDPATHSLATLRGFPGGAIGYMYDGIQLSGPQMLSRDYDSFNFDRVEVLKGPSSVISGNGALAGTINLVTKQPILGQNLSQGLLSYGSFDRLRMGGDYNVAVGENAAVRASAVFSQANGYIDDTDSRTAAVTLGATAALSDRLTTTFSLDYYHDAFRTPYEGTPLIARSAAISPSNIVSAPGGLAIDRALRNRNYNFNNGEMASDTLWLRNRTDYELTDNWTIRNDVGFYTAKRPWANSEAFTYNGATGLLDRSSDLITNDQQVFYEQISARFDGAIAGMRHRFAAGLAYNHTELLSERRFGEATPVSPYFPIRGFVPADTAANFPTRQNFNSRLDTFAVFAEDAINLTDKWLVVAGGRYETIRLDRSIFDLNTVAAPQSFDQTYNSVSWRLGTVYEILPGTVLFAQYNQATVPVSTLLLSNISNARFELSTGQSAEAGIKATFWDNRAVASLSIYQIDQDNILTRDPANTALTIQGGSQRSRGIEAEIAVALTDHLKLTANASYIKAEYTELWSPAGDLAGNRPVNVPEWTAFVMADYKVPGLPMTVSASAQYVGSFYADTTNTIEIDGHTVVDAWISYELGPGTLRLRGRNLFDAFYADWAADNPTQVYIAAPRSIELSYVAKF